MILGPDDPRAITGEAFEEAKRNTELWNTMLGFKPPSGADKARYERELQEVLDMIGYKP